MVKNPPANAGGSRDTRSIPGLGSKIPHALQGSQKKKKKKDMVNSIIGISEIMRMF